MRTCSHISVFLFLSIGLVTTANAAEVPVTSHQDLSITASGGDCGLRQAVQAAQTDSPVGGCPSGSGDDRIILAGGDYKLSIPGADENDNATGDLDGFSTDRLEIIGTDPQTPTRIIGGGDDRVIHVLQDSQLELTDLTITGGRILTPGEYGGPIGGGVAVQGDDVFPNDPNPPVDYKHGGHLSLVRVTVTGNFSAGYGGGIASSGYLVAEDSTISGNSSDDLGGGIYLDSLGTFAGANLTISNNQASSGAGGLNEGESPVWRWGTGNGTQSLTNSVLAGNKGPGGDCATSHTGSFPTEFVHVLVSSSQDMDQCPLSLDSKVIKTDWPGLKPLATSNGSEVMDLLPGSPAIGAGTSCTPQDQTGTPRTARCDIGAVQYQGKTPFQGLRLAATQSKKTRNGQTIHLKASIGINGHANNARVCLTRQTLRKYFVNGNTCRKAGTLKPGSPRYITFNIHRRTRTTGTPAIHITLTATGFRPRTIQTPGR